MRLICINPDPLNDQYSTSDIKAFKRFRFYYAKESKYHKYEALLVKDEVAKKKPNQSWVTIEKKELTDYFQIIDEQ